MRQIRVWAASFASRPATADRSPTMLAAWPWTGLDPQTCVTESFEATRTRVFDAPFDGTSEVGPKQTKQALQSAFVLHAN
jgi:hypothetical protein